MNLSEAYRRLGLNGTESLEEVRCAYRDLAQILHPDKFAHSEVKQHRAEEQFKQIKEAYDYILEHQKGSQSAARTQESTSYKKSPTADKHAIEDALETLETQAKYTVLSLVISLIVGAVIRNPLIVSIAGCVVVTCFIRSLTLFRQMSTLRTEWKKIVSREANTKS